MREESALVTLSLPSAYSFCASMMMRVLLEGEAVEGEVVDERIDGRMCI